MFSLDNLAIGLSKVYHRWPLPRGKRLFGRWLRRVVDKRPVLSRYNVLMEAHFEDTTNWLCFDGYGSPEIESFFQLLQPGECLIDVGANQGIFSTLAYTKVGPSGLVIAVEPQVELASRLRRNAILNSAEIVLLNAALSNERELVGLTPANPTHSGIRRIDLDVGSAADYVWSSPFPRDLAKLIEKRKVFLKVDCEGFELKVLQGLAEILETGQVFAAVVEIDSEYLERYGASVKEVYSLLDSYGLRASGRARTGHYDELFLSHP